MLSSRKQKRVPSRGNLTPEPSSSKLRRPPRRGKRWNHKISLCALCFEVAAIGWFLLLLYYWTTLSHQLADYLLEQIPTEGDLELGEQVLKNHLIGMSYYDPAWTPKLQEIGEELMDSATVMADKMNDYDWDFGVLQQDDVVNAFVWPSGTMRITSGLLKELSLTNGELAALLAHQMGHVLLRHIPARIIARRTLRLFVAALFYNDHEDHKETFGEAAGELLLQYGTKWLGARQNYQQLLSFTMNQELQADEIAWQLLWSSENHFHPQALESLLTKLGNHRPEQKLRGNAASCWESTHPGSEFRVLALQKKWQDLSDDERKRADMFTIR